MSKEFYWNSIAEYGDKIALETASAVFSYAELDALAKAFAKNIPERSLIFLICKNCPEVVSAYIGCLQKKIIPVLIGDSVHKDLFAELRRKYKPNYIWCPNSLLEDESSCYLWQDYKLIDCKTDCHQSNDDLALLITTSGSTGSPKFVRQSYKNIQSNTASIVEYLKIAGTDKAITTLPMNYTYGLSIVQSHLMAGSTILLTDLTFFSKDFWTLIKEKQATTFGAVPYSYQMLDRLRFLNMDLPSVKYLTQAGGRLDRDLHAKYAKGLQEKGKSFVVMYGATEATARMSYVPSERSLEKAGSIGIAIPGGRFELIDENGSVITTPETIGELAYYGDNVTLGYAESLEDLQKGDENFGCLKTGDMAKFDEDGFFYIVGRKKRFLKLFGNRVNLVEVESLLAAKGFECACVGEDDHMRIYSTGTGIEKDVVDFVSSITGINRVAFKCIHIDVFPRNSSGKILYSELK